MHSCQKELGNDQADMYERFFKLPKDASAAVIDMANTIRKLENQLNIAHKVIGNNSLPAWSNTLQIDTKDFVNTSSVSSRGAIEAGSGSFRTVVTAVTDITTNQVTAYVKFMRAGDTVRVRYIEKLTAINNYQVAGSKLEKDKAIQDLMYFAYFEKELNQVEKLNLKSISITPVGTGNTTNALMLACSGRICETWSYTYSLPSGEVMGVSGQTCYYVNLCTTGGGGSGVTFQGCGSGGPCSYGGNGGGGNLTGGTGPNGSNYWGLPIYSTQEGGGNGTNPRDSLLKDSTIKDFLKKDMIAFKSLADSAFALDSNKREWGFSFGVNFGIRRPLDFHTNNRRYEWIPNWNLMYNFDTCFGTLHTHEDVNSNERIIQDITDVFVLKEYLDDSRRKGKYFPRSYVTCGDKIYAVVIEDRAKALAFYNSNDVDDLQDANTTEINTFSATVTRRQRSINSLLRILGNSSSSGLGLYESIPPQNINFIKLN